MGKIKTESIKGTIFTYTGALFGLLNAGLLFPRILSTEEIGFFGVLIAYSIIISQFGSLGWASTTTRMFPFFRDNENKHNGFLFLSILITSIGFLLSMLFVFGYKQDIISDKGITNQLLSNYFYYLVSLVLFTLSFNMLDHYSKVMYKASRGIFLKDFLQKFIISVILIMYNYELLSFKQLVFFYFFSFFIPTIVIAIQIIRDRESSLKMDFSLLDRKMVKTMISVSFYGILTSATGVIVINIDKIMIKDFIGLENTGIYTICFFVGTVIALHSRITNCKVHF